MAATMQRLLIARSGIRAAAAAAIRPTTTPAGAMFAR